MARIAPQFLDTSVLLMVAADDPPPEFDPGRPIRTGILNLLEMVHVILRRGATATAERAFDRFSPVAIGLDRERIFDAARLRVRHPDRGLSYADAAGLATARSLGAEFLTTDSGFHGLPGCRRVSPRTV